MSGVRHILIGMLFFSLCCPAFADDFDSQPTSPPAYYNRAVEANTMSVAEKNYLKLREILPLYQQAVLNPWPTLPTNLKLKRGAKGIMVGLLKQRLHATGDLPIDDNSNIFDSYVMDAVKRFQLRSGLKADGVVGKNTLLELNVPPDVRVRQIEVNMERWSTLSPLLGKRFLMVNVPDYELYLYENNEKILSMKIIVGKVDRQTPELSSTITRLVFNPYWNVPDMIAQKDIAPKMVDNPYYLDEMRIRVLNSQRDDAGEISPDAIDWQAAKLNGVPYRLRQEPGPENALGLVKFEFFNNSNVYLHDTPAKNLFADDVRTMSSGCVRLEKPFELVDYLMQDDPNWSSYREEAILAMGRTVYVKPARPIPIFITYITAWVDENGLINFRDDIYGRDDDGMAAVLSAR